MGRWWAVPLLVTGLLSGCVEGGEPTGFFFAYAEKVRCGDGPAELLLRIDAGLEGGTGESSATLVATNRGPEACRMIGYPELTLRDAAGNLLPFTISHTGNQALSGRPPEPVVAAVGEDLVVAYGKYRCDLPGSVAAASMTVTLPDSPTVTLQLPSSPVPGTPSYCGPGDPGSTLVVTPIAGSIAELGRNPRRT